LILEGRGRIVLKYIRVRASRINTKIPCLHRSQPKASCNMRAGVCLLPLILVACSTLTHYPVDSQNLVSDFEGGSSEEAFGQADKRSKKGLDRLAYLLEGGMILHTWGQLEASNAEFSEAEGVIRHHEEKAVVSLSKGTAQVGSVFLNEKTLPYTGEPFEKVLVHTFKASNYLFLYDYEGARVEIRRSFARQKENERMHQKEYERAQDEAKSRGISSRGVFRAVDVHYQDQKEIVRRAKNLYEDAFAYYLSAIVYELNREYNDAYIDLKKVQDLRPGVPYVENDLLRMAMRSGLSDELKENVKRLGKQPRMWNERREGEVIIFFGSGMAPRKTQIKISIPIPDVGIVPVAFPKYEPVPNPVSYGALYDRQGHLYGRTFVLTDLEAIAIRNLDDRMTTLALKQVFRSAVKGAMVKTARDQGGWAADMVANLYNVITEQADLRCWQTLPQNMQVARVFLPAGRHELVFALHSKTGGRVQEREFVLDVRPGETIFVSARTGPWDLIGFNVFQLGPSGVDRVE
jgi:hypothetical protein